MNARIRTAFLVLLLAGLTVAGSAFAQSAAPPGNPMFTQQELDQMLAPVALYPDPLLGQMLIASTYPLQVVEAARWSQANPNLTGTDAVNAVADQDWDPNVKALVAFPDLLQMMSDKLEWTENVGNALLGQQAQVMDTVQTLRHRAEAAGTLQSGGELRVEDNDGVIDIEPAAPDLVYLPYYDPNVVYGNWWWPDYPPVYWAAWPGYGWQGGFAWGFGVAIGIDFFCNDFDWVHRRIDVFAHGRPSHERFGFARDEREQPRIWRHASERHSDIASVTRQAFGNRGAETFTQRAAPADPRVYQRAERAPAMQQREFASPRAYGGIERAAPPRAYEGTGRAAAPRAFSMHGASGGQRAAPAAAHRGGR